MISAIFALIYMYASMFGYQIIQEPHILGGAIVLEIIIEGAIIIFIKEMK